MLLSELSLVSTLYKILTLGRLSKLLLLSLNRICLSLELPVGNYSLSAFGELLSFFFVLKRSFQLMKSRFRIIPKPWVLSDDLVK